MEDNPKEKYEKYEIISTTWHSQKNTKRNSTKYEELRFSFWPGKRDLVFEFSYFSYFSFTTEDGPSFIFAQKKRRTWKKLEIKACKLKTTLKKRHAKKNLLVGQIQPPNDPSYVVRTDIKYITGAATFYNIDVAIIDPASAGPHPLSLDPGRCFFKIRADQETALFSD